MWTSWLTLVISGALPMIQCEFVLEILHTNDMHSRFNEANKYGSKCHPDATCYGGFPRLAHLVNQEKSKRDNVLFLTAGDIYQGTIWYSLYKWRVVAEFVNMLPLDAMVS